MLIMLKTAIDKRNQNGVCGNIVVLKKLYKFSQGDNLLSLIVYAENDQVNSVFYRTAENAEFLPYHI